MSGHKKTCEKTCEVCHEVFFVERYRINTARYCSTECMYVSDERNARTGVGNSGKVRSDDFKTKVSKSMVDMYKQQEVDGTKKAGVLSSMYGRVRELSPAWRGGVSFAPYPVLWNDGFKWGVRERFGSKCFLCGNSGDNSEKALHVHHVDYVKDNLSQDNLVPLCHGCHVQTNHHRSFWTWFFGEKLIGERHTLINVGKGE